MLWIRKKKEKDVVVVDKELFDKEMNNLIMNRIVNSLEYLFNPQFRITGPLFGKMPKDVILENFEKIISERVDLFGSKVLNDLEEIKNDVKKQVGDYIRGEEFIDRIIDRINCKQIISSDIKKRK